MLRSFDYATNVALRQQVDRGLLPDLPTATSRLGQWTRLWTTYVGGCYLAGYLDAADGQVFLPSESADMRLLLDLFLLEKACYEVRYELDHRPDWVGIPLQALADLVTSFPEWGETPA